MTFSPLEVAAFAFTLVNVWLAVKENIWTWPTGIVGVALYTIVNYRAHLYSNAGLQIVYLLLSIHGWYEWLHGGENKTELHVRRTTRRQWIWCLFAGSAGTAALIALLRWTTDAAFPFWDASTTAFSLVGQWMLNEKMLENWAIWLVVDIIYVPIYFFGGQRLTAGLYVIFCVLCIRGLIEWKRSVARVSGIGNRDSGV
ncbi:MAG TPA: nicotinamide riboside transporter PnuC [Thermoanaerobaculia bacterium]|nr:nicotinamide riboside transporter PnuC [Thermoanaerobaculia bacterium]